MNAKVLPMRRTERPRHIANLHPSLGRQVAGTPVVDLFDWAEHIDRPVLPTLQKLQLERLIQSVLTPGIFTREQAVEAATGLQAYFSTGDDCPPKGMPRPPLGGVS